MKIHWEIIIAAVILAAAIVVAGYLIGHAILIKNLIVYQG